MLPPAAFTQFELVNCDSVTQYQCHAVSVSHYRVYYRHTPDIACYLLQRPLDFGADATFHSVSKYMNGHTDVIMGAVLTNNAKFANDIRFLQNGSFTSSEEIMFCFIPAGPAISISVVHTQLLALPLHQWTATWQTEE